MLITITRDMIRLGISKGGYNKKQLQALGVPWPPEKGWIDRFHNIQIDETAYKRFLSLKGKSGRKKKPSKNRVAKDDFLESYEWRKLRYRALLKEGKRCQCCGRSPKDGIILHVDHIKPRKKYPQLALSIENLQILCHECNHGKGNWDETDHR